MVYTITLNPAIDFVINTDKLITGAINRSYSDEIFCGGKGINVSLVLNELKVETKALGFVAGFTGDMIEKVMLWFKENAYAKERLGAAIDRLGTEKLEADLSTDDLLKRKEEILTKDILA